MTADSTRRNAVDVELYVRPAQLHETLEEYVGTLQRLDDDVVDGVAVHSWPGRVPVRSPATDAVDRFREFRRWADEQDVSIQPPFAVRRVTSTLLDEEGTYLSTPVLCLAVRNAGTLAAVYPHTDGDAHRSVADGLDALAAGEVDDPDPRDDPVPSILCVHCGSRLVNVQGVAVCHDCAWVDPEPPASRPGTISP